MCRVCAKSEVVNYCFFCLEIGRIGWNLVEGNRNKYEVLRKYAGRNQDTRKKPIFSISRQNSEFSCEANGHTFYC